MNNNLRNRHRGIYTHKSHAQTREINANSTAIYKTYPIQLSADSSNPDDTKEKNLFEKSIDKINLNCERKEFEQVHWQFFFLSLVGETFLPLHSPLTGMRMGNR